MKRHKSKIFIIPRVSPTVQLLVAIIIFIISVLLTRDSDIASWEVGVFNYVYSLPRFLYPFFFVITQTGSIYILAVLLIFLMIKKYYVVVVRLLLSGTLAYLVSGVAKDLWGRGRPNDYIMNIVNLDYVVRGPGFPSGHTALATALALTMAHYLPKKYHWIVVLWIVGVGLSRIYLGIHFPLDIIGGFAIGWAAYALFRHVSLNNVRFGKRPPKKVVPARK